MYILKVGYVLSHEQQLIQIYQYVGTVAYANVPIGPDRCLHARCS